MGAGQLKCSRLPTTGTGLPVEHSRIIDPNGRACMRVDRYCQRKRLCDLPPRCHSPGTATRRMVGLGRQPSPPQPNFGESLIGARTSFDCAPKINQPAQWRLVPKRPSAGANVLIGSILRYLFEYFISTSEDRGGNGDPKFLSGPQVDGGLEL